MIKIIFHILILFLIHSDVARGDRRFQNANLDFINFESNNKKYPTQPQPLPTANQGIDPLKFNAPISTSTTTSKTPTQNQPKVQQNLLTPTSSLKPPTNVINVAPAATTPKAPTSVVNVAPAVTTPKSGVNVRQMVRDYDSRATATSTTLKPNVNRQNSGDSFPSLPKVGSGPQTPTGTGPSWASIAAGKTSNVPTTPTRTTPGIPNSPNTPGVPNRNVPNIPNVPNSPNTPGSPNRNVPNVPTPGNRSPSVPSSPTRVTPGVPNSPTDPKHNLQYPTLAPPLRTTQKSATTPHPLIATDKELSDISEALLTKDVNNPSKYLTVNVQKKTTSFNKDDLAPEPLFTVDPAVWNIPTIAAMKTLLDNYEQDATINEHITPQERNEENAFMDAIMSTSVIRHLMSFLKDKGVVSPDPKQQRDVLKQTWFNMYSRGQGKIGSSGFEHIFLSEIKNNEISGLHNWLYFYLEEAGQRANYLGHLKKVDFSNKGSVLKLHFSMKGIDKPVATMFVGTSPELEMALYSLCFYTRPDQPCPLSLGGQVFNLRTHTFRYRSKNMIGSAFPEI